MIEGNVIYIWMVVLGTSFLLFFKITDLTESKNKRIVILTTIPAFVSIIGFAALFLKNMIIEEDFLYGIYACLVGGLFAAIGCIITIFLSGFIVWLHNIWETLKT